MRECPLPFCCEHVEALHPENCLRFGIFLRHGGLVKSLAEESKEMDWKNRVCSKAMAFIQGSLKFASAPCKTS